MKPNNVGWFFNINDVINEMNQTLNINEKTENPFVTENVPEIYSANPESLNWE